MDSTCRLWSSRNGQLLFQINVPGPVQSLHVDMRDYLYMSCLNRLVIFSINAFMKDDDVPHYWYVSNSKSPLGALCSRASLGIKLKRPK